MVRNLPAMPESQVPGFLGGTSGKELQPMQETRDVGSPLGQEDPLEEGMAAHSSILAWRIPWTEGPGGPQSIGSKGSDLTEMT